jgi:sulfur-carrier protein adenylyltransferase/sulfurtransferase
MNTRLQLSVILLLLGLLLAFLPSSGKYSFHGKPDELLTAVLDENTGFTADHIARFLVAEDSTVQLVDLRPAEEFNNFSIPGAINLPYSSFLSNDLESILNRDIRTIFYSNGDLESGYALVIARGLGYKNCYVMKGGMNDWFSKVMNSSFSGTSLTPRENALFEARKKARNLFTELNSMPDSLKARYRQSKEIERKKLDGGCE